MYYIKKEYDHNSIDVVWIHFQKHRAVKSFRTSWIGQIHSVMLHTLHPVHGVYLNATPSVKKPLLLISFGISSFRCVLKLMSVWEVKGFIFISGWCPCGASSQQWRESFCPASVFIYNVDNFNYWLYNNNKRYNNQWVILIKQTKGRCCVIVLYILFSMLLLQGLNLHPSGFHRNLDNI